MGLSHAQQAHDDSERRRKLKLADDQPEKQERGHGRGKTVVDLRRGADAGLRGIPLIGVGAGAIAGTAPGGELGAVARLERAAKDLNEAGQEIVRRKMRQARGRS